jgi:hypothetical protein
MERGIEASTTLRAPIDRARDILCGDPGCVFADRSTAEERQARCFHTTLGVEAGGGGVQQAVVVATGLPDTTDDTVTLPVQWHAAGHERLFPTFTGALEVRGEGLKTQVTLRGAYTVPLGIVGRFGDGVVGRRAARQSLTSFVEQVARRLDAEADRRMNSVAFHPAPYAVDLREVGPENYIG